MSCPDEASIAEPLSETLKLGLDAFGSDHPVNGAVPLRQPRIGLYKSYIPNIDEGWTRWLLEQYEFAYTSLYNKDIRAGDLNARFDVIIIPDTGVASLVNGAPSLATSGSSPVPPE